MSPGQVRVQLSALAVTNNVVVTVLSGACNSLVELVTVAVLVISVSSAVPEFIL
jgi:hypothetical protein